MCSAPPPLMPTITYTIGIRVKKNLSYSYMASYKLTTDNIFQKQWLTSSEAKTEIICFSSEDLRHGAGACKFRWNGEKQIQVGGGHKEVICCSSTLDKRGLKINDDCRFEIIIKRRQEIKEPPKLPRKGKYLSRRRGLLYLLRNTTTIVCRKELFLLFAKRYIY